MIQVHPQLEEGVTGHGVLPNQQMFKLNEALFTPTFERCKRFLAHEAECPEKSFAARCALRARCRRRRGAKSVSPACRASAARLRRGGAAGHHVARGRTA